MTTDGAFAAIRLPILGTLGKGRRAAVSANRLSGTQAPHPMPATVPHPAEAGFAGAPQQQA